MIPFQPLLLIPAKVRNWALARFKRHCALYWWINNYNESLTAPYLFLLFTLPLMDTVHLAYSTKVFGVTWKLSIHIYTAYQTMRKHVVVAAHGFHNLNKTTKAHVCMPISDGLNVLMLRVGKVRRILYSRWMFGKVSARISQTSANAYSHEHRWINLQGLLQPVRWLQGYMGSYYGLLW